MYVLAVFAAALAGSQIAAAAIVHEIKAENAVVLEKVNDGKWKDVGSSGWHTMEAVHGHDKAHPSSHPTAEKDKPKTKAKSKPEPKHPHKRPDLHKSSTQKAHPDSSHPDSYAHPHSEAKTLPSTGYNTTTYRHHVLYHHNIHRSNHSAVPLTWSPHLASLAHEIASSCIYAHNLSPGGGGYGQNIAAGTPASAIAAVISNEFYNGEVNWFAGLYGEAQPDMSAFEHWGHFSQLVWNATTTVGCATQYCGAGLANVGAFVRPWFTVCNYGPPGNWAGEYAENVGRSRGMATVSARG